jgi:low affinity Fe/Cu permease
MAEKRDAIGEEFSATERKVDRIREILIGTQMQTMGQRIEAIETQLEQQVVSLRENKTRLTALESVLEKQIPELSDRCQQTFEANEHLRQSTVHRIGDREHPR